MYLKKVQIIINLFELILIIIATKSMILYLLFNLYDNLLIICVSYPIGIV